MKESGLLIPVSGKVRVSKFGEMGQSMKASSTMIRLKAKVDSYMLMETFTRATG